jgi:hypothetical protein
MPTRNSGSAGSLKSEIFSDKNLNDLANGFFGRGRWKDIPVSETKRSEINPALLPAVDALDAVSKEKKAATDKWQARPNDANRSELDRSIDRMVAAVANFQKALSELRPSENSLKSDLGGRMSAQQASMLTLSNSKGMTGDEIRAAQRAAYGAKGYAVQLHDSGYRTKYPDEYGQTYDSHLVGENNSKTVQKLAAQALGELSKKSTDTMTNQEVEKFVDDYVSKASKGRFKSVKWNSKSYPD